MARRANLDLSEFENLGKIPFAERYEKIKKVFPSVEDLDWRRVFRDDPAILGEIINDIIRFTAAQRNRPGKRGAVDAATTAEKLREYMGDDYSLEPFSTTFNNLKGQRSIRQLAAKVGLDRNIVYRLLRGEAEPDAYIMEQVAKAFKKNPSYFAEYRVSWITATLAAKLDDIPEASIHFYRKMKRDV